MPRISIAQKARQGSLGFLAQLLARRIDRRMKVQLDEIGIDQKVFMILMERDGLTQRELGRMADVPEYATSRTIDGLVAEGLIERRPDPNSRRSHLIFLTSAGLARFTDTVLEDVKGLHFTGTQRLRCEFSSGSRPLP